ncbi:MAK16-like protein, partial [Trifolium medium]|nr:MAK16-like protein [Trifolium medium]
EKITTLPRKEVKREARREQKAEKAAVINKAIEQELVERLKNGLYQENDIVNYPFEAYKKVVDLENRQPAEEEEELEIEKEYVEGYEFEEEDDIEDFGAFAIHESLGNDSDDENENLG